MRCFDIANFYVKILSAMNAVYKFINIGMIENPIIKP